MINTETLLPIRQKHNIQRIGETMIRYSLALVIAWIGGMKFTAFEAAAIEPLVSTSPLLNWTYGFLSLQAVSSMLGVVEITTAILIAAKPFSPGLSTFGSALAIAMFSTTLTFLVSLPGWEPSLGGFPALSGSGGFLIKDIVLFGAAIWTLGDSLETIRQS